MDFQLDSQRWSDSPGDGAGKAHLSPLFLDLYPLNQQSKPPISG